MIDSGSQNHSHTWFVMVFVILCAFIVAFRGISKGENPKMKPKVRFCGLTSCFTLLVEWRKVPYALKSFKHIFRNYWAHYTKETIQSINVRNAGQCDHLPFGLPKTFVVYLLPWVGFWVTCTNNVCDVCQNFCLKHHWKFMNTVYNMFFKKL